MEYIYGLLTIPVLYITLVALRILIPAVIDTWKLTIKLSIKEGYSKLHWLYIYPLCVPVIFWDELKTQIWAWWHGIYTRVS